MHKDKEVDAVRIFAATPWALKQAFGFFGLPGGVVALVGGGGKSTLMYFMASTCAKQGKKVLVTTTTRIYRPTKNLAEDMDALHALWASGNYGVIGTPVPGGKKLRAPEKTLWQQAMAAADVVFIEADGARHQPVKVPGPEEPVLPDAAELVIGVLGLSAIGQPLKYCCFRPEAAAEILGTDVEHILTEEDAAQLLASDAGSRKNLDGRRFCAVLNQCDDGKRRRSADKIAAHLALLGVPQVVMTAFDPEERVHYNQLAGCPAKE